MSACLLHAVDDIVEGHQHAFLKGDVDAAERLAHLARAVEVEAEYADGVDGGLPIVRRRTGPPGRTVGWYFAHDPHTRTLRRARRLWLPEEISS